MGPDKKLFEWVLKHQFLRFVVVGGSGFLIDLGLLYLLSVWFFIPPFFARIISLAVTSIIIWPFHRKFAFAKSQDGVAPELMRYYAVVILAALVNYFTFVGSLFIFDNSWLLVPMIIAAFAAMLVSFIGFKIFVFRGKN